ncbi:MAG: DUF1573 domain-containing protein [Puniceicoccaceae bacterium]
MKKWITALLTLAATGTQICLAELAFESESVEVPASLMDEKIEAVFKFQNAGSKTVKISKVVASCGCTSPILNKKTYAPGEFGEIKAVFTFGSRIGKQEKRILVYTDDKKQEVIPLVLKTSIPNWVEMSTRLLKWRKDEPGKPLRFTVKVADNERIQIAPVEAGLPQFDFKIAHHRPGEYVFEVTPKSVSQRATAFLRFNAIASDGGTTRERQFGVHCLIR